MVNNDIVRKIREMKSRGVGIQAACNFLVQNGYNQDDVNNAVEYVRKQNFLQNSGSPLSDRTEPERGMDKNMLILYYAIAIGGIAAASVIALFVLGMI